MVCHTGGVRRLNIFFIAVGIGAALLAVAYKVWTDGVEMDVRCGGRSCEVLDTQRANNEN